MRSPQLFSSVPFASYFRIGGSARPAHERYVEATRVHADDIVINEGPLDDAVDQVIALVRRRRVDGLAGAHQR